MTDARAFRGCRFPAAVILWAVRWSLQFGISYRDLERMLADRGVEAALALGDLAHVKDVVGRLVGHGVRR